MKQIKLNTSGGVVWYEGKNKKGDIEEELF
jgi:hypothetical protein